MKLLQILARELNEWPAGDCGCDSITQDANGRLNATEKGYTPIFSESQSQWVGSASTFIFDTGGVFISAELATDYATAIITREQWEAERQRGAVWRGPEDGLPPAGTVCEVLYSGDWHETYIVGSSRYGSAVFECEDFSYGFAYNGYSDSEFFRPIQSDRDKWIAAAEAVIESHEGCVAYSSHLARLYDAGLAKLAS